MALSDGDFAFAPSSAHVPIPRQGTYRTGSFVLSTSPPGWFSSRFASRPLVAASFLNAQLRERRPAVDTFDRTRSVATPASFVISMPLRLQCGEKIVDLCRRRHVRQEGESSHVRRTQGSRALCPTAMSLTYRVVISLQTRYRPKIPPPLSMVVRPAFLGIYFGGNLLDSIETQQLRSSGATFGSFPIKIADFDRLSGHPRTGVKHFCTLIAALPCVRPPVSALGAGPLPLIS